jgi:hypothetical protein
MPDDARLVFASRFFTRQAWASLEPGSVAPSPRAYAVFRKQTAPTHGLEQGVSGKQI